MATSSKRWSRPAAAIALAVSSSRVLRISFSMSWRQSINGVTLGGEAPGTFNSSSVAKPWSMMPAAQGGPVLGGVARTLANVLDAIALAAHLKVHNERNRAEPHTTPSARMARAHVASAAAPAGHPRGCGRRLQGHSSSGLRGRAWRRGESGWHRGSGRSRAP